MTDFTGRVVAVTVDTLGDELVLPALAGATSLYVDDAADFNEDGGSLRLAAQVVEYLAADDATGIVTLSEALVADAEAGDRVEIWDSEALTPVTETTAHVAVEGSELADDTLEAIVEHTLIPYLPEGIRDGLGEAVALEWRGATLFVQTILGRVPFFDGSMIDPSTLPAGGSPWGEDPPADAPVISVSPFAVGAVQASWSPMADAQSFEVAASLTTPVPADAIVATVSSPRFTLSDLAGVSLPMGDGALPVNLKVRAVNPNGAGPWSSEGSATARQADNEFISAMYAYLGNIEASQLSSGTIDADLSYVGKQYIGPLDGRHIEIDPAVGLTLFAEDGVTEVVKLNIADSLSVFRGRIETDIAAVMDALELSGSGSRILSGGGMTLESGVADPSAAPTLLATKNTAAWPAVPDGWTERAIDWSEDDGLFYRLIWKSGRLGVQSVAPGSSSASTIFTTDFAVSSAWSHVKIGSWFFVLTLNSSGDYWIYRFSASGGFSTQSTYVTSTNLALGNPVIGRGGPTGLIVAWRSTSNSIIVEQASQSLGGVLPAFAELDDDSTAALPLRFAQINTFDGGASRLALAHGATLRFLPAPVWDNGTTVVDAPPTLEDTTLDVVLGNGGMTYRPSGTSAGFYSVAAADKLVRRWSSYVPAVAGEKWFARHADTDGTLTTAPSPVGSIVMPARWWPAVQLPPAPASAPLARVYVGYGATDSGTYRLRSEALTGRTMLLTNLRVTTGSATLPTNTFGAGTPAWLKSGSGGFELNGDGSGSWPGMTTAFYRRAQTAAQSLTSGSLTSAAAFADAVDTDGSWSYAAGVFTCVTPGLYSLVGQVKWDSNGTGLRRMDLKKNGSAIGVATVPASAGAFYVQVVATARFAVGDTVGANFLQNCGSALSTSGDASTYLQLTRLGA